MNIKQERSGDALVCALEGEVNISTSPELRKIFAEIKREELKAFDNEITPLERSTYL